MAQKDVQGYVRPLALRLADEMGFEFVDAELVKEGPGRYLRIYLDKDGGFTLDDCERFHRAIQPRLEQVDYDFLEVSSPGVDRPLKTDRDLEKGLGTEVEVRLYKAVDGKKAFQGVLAAYDAEALTVRTPDGERTFPRRDTALVKPVIHFDDDETDEGEGMP